MAVMNYNPCPITAPPVQECDAMPAANSAEAGSKKLVLRLLPFCAFAATEVGFGVVTREGFEVLYKM